MRFIQSEHSNQWHFGGNLNRVSAIESLQTEKNTYHNNDVP